MEECEWVLGRGGSHRGNSALCMAVAPAPFRQRENLREADSWVPFLPQLSMFIPRTSRSARSQRNPQSELRGETHATLGKWPTAVFPNKLIERTSGLMISQCSFSSPQTTGQTPAWNPLSCLSARFLDALRSLALSVLKDSTQSCVVLSLDFQIFPVFIFSLLPASSVLGVGGKLTACHASPARNLPHIALPPFLSVSPASPAPTEESKLMPSNWYKGTFCFYATHAKRRGKKEGKNPTDG